MIEGSVAAGLEPVAEAFAANFAEHDEVGAAFAVARGHELLVDLWGGTAASATDRPWRRDTLSVIFSGTKGVLAVAILMLVERGQIELDAPVTRYWPEFGKRDVLVRQVMSHTARLPGLDEPLSADDILDAGLVAERLERQALSDDPRAGFCYHGLTFGWLCGELIRRVDGRSVGRFVADEIARPLELELWIGLPAEHEARVSALELAPGWPAWPAMRAEHMANDALLRSIWGNPPLLLDSDSMAWNRSDFHAAGIPGAGGIGTARAVARLYANLDRLLEPATLATGRETLAEGRDEAHDGHARFGVGFELQTEDRRLGPPDDAFGHRGVGGSNHGAWPRHGIGFSYVMNRLRDDVTPDPRAHALLAALHDALR